VSAYLPLKSKILLERFALPLHGLTLTEMKELILEFLGQCGRTLTQLKMKRKSKQVPLQALLVQRELREDDKEST
jgi:hypothetical protein